MAALDAALDVWDDVSMTDVRDASIALADLFIREVEARCPELARLRADGKRRAARFRFVTGRLRDHAALIARDVIGTSRGGT